MVRVDAEIAGNFHSPVADVLSRQPFIIEHAYCRRVSVEASRTDCDDTTLDFDAIAGAIHHDSDLRIANNDGAREVGKFPLPPHLRKG